MSRKMAITVIMIILLIGMAVAYAASRPAILDWLLGYDGAANQPYAAGRSLASSAQNISGENTADHITVRMNSLVYDGERFSFSYEVENDVPEEPALVAIDHSLLVNGETVYLDEFLANDAGPFLVPSARLNVLPVRRNPISCGGWSQIIPEVLNGTVACKMTFIVYRPRKAFAIVPDPDDLMFHIDDCGPEEQSEIQDVINTYRSFQNAVIADRDNLDPEEWFKEGYTVIGGYHEVTEWIDPNEESFDHLVETARFSVFFTFDANNKQAFDFSGTENVILDDCILSVNRFRLSPLTTNIDLFLIPHENTEAAARSLVQKYGPLDLTDEHGIPVEYAQMDSIYENTPWVSQHDGQWLCRYLIQMPGLQEWPESVGLTVKTGDLLRVGLLESHK